MQPLKRHKFHGFGLEETAKCNHSVIFYRRHCLLAEIMRTRVWILNVLLPFKYTSLIKNFHLGKNKTIIIIYLSLRQWNKNDFAYAMDSDVISYGYKKDFQSKEDEKYDLSEVSLLEIISLSIYSRKQRVWLFLTNREAGRKFKVTNTLSFFVWKK